MSAKVTIVGHVGGDPELRYTATGVAAARFSVASNRQWKVADGTVKKETTWFRVIAWRGLGESCAEYLTKGRQVRVEGRLIPDLATGGPRIWVGKDGVGRASFEVQALEVEFLGPSPIKGEDDLPEEPPSEEAPF